MIFFSASECTTPSFFKQDGSLACGFFLAQGLTWSQANAGCSDMGARLPVINTEQENKDLFNILVKKNLK